MALELHGASVGPTAIVPSSQLRFLRKTSSEKFDGAGHLSREFAKMSLNRNTRPGSSVVNGLLHAVEHARADENAGIDPDSNRNSKNNDNSYVSPTKGRWTSPAPSSVRNGKQPMPPQAASPYNNSNNNKAQANNNSNNNNGSIRQKRHMVSSSSADKIYSNNNNNNNNNSNNNNNNHLRPKSGSHVLQPAAAAAAVYPASKSRDAVRSSAPLYTSRSDNSPPNSSSSCTNSSSYSSMNDNLNKNNNNDSNTNNNSAFFVAYCDPEAERAKAAKRVEDRRRRDHQKAQSEEAQRMEQKRMDAERLQAKAGEKELQRARIYALNKLMRKQEWAIYKQYERESLLARPNVVSSSPKSPPSYNNSNVPKQIHAA